MASVLTMPNSDNIYVWNNESCVRFEYRTSFRSLNCYWTKEDAVKIAEAILKEVEELENEEQTS